MTRPMQNKIAALSASCVMLLWTMARAQDATILDMDTVRHKPGQMAGKDNQQVPVGTVELVEGKFGKACQFSFAEEARAGFMTAWVVASPEWDQAAGFSFWVKGDGSASWGGLEFIDGTDYKLRYGYCFPIDSTEWTKVVVPWRDVIPELAGPLVDPAHGYAPSRFRNIWVGKWHYWRDYPAHAFALDQMALEKSIPGADVDYTPKEAGTPRFLAKLKARQAVTVVTMGDSLSDKRHWANKEKLWSEEFVKQLKAQYGSEVTLVNPAIGGTTLSQNLITMPRWLKGTPKPDLVTVCFGFNDWDSGVRGDRFKEYLNLAVDRIRRQTKGEADILLITTCPAHDRWRTMDEMARAVRTVAAERKTGLADLAVAFHKAGSAEEALKQGYWAWDKTHLGAKGHDIVAEVVSKAVATPGLPEIPASEEAPAPAAGQAATGAGGDATLFYGFEPDEAAMVTITSGAVVKEHATQGASAVRLTRDPQQYAMIAVGDGVALRKLRENSRLLVDVLNPQDKPVTMGIRMDDAQSSNYATRYNNDGYVVQPGKSTIDLDYSKLKVSGGGRELDPAAIGLLLFMLHPGPNADALFFDNMRFAPVGAPVAVEKPAAASTPPPPAPAAPAAAAPAKASPSGPALLSSFEPGGPNWVKGGTAVKEHATDGEYSCKIECDGKGFTGISIDDPAALRRFKDYALLHIDIFNPQSTPMGFGCRIDDAKSVSYGTRYNDDACMAPPGKSTFEVNLTGLTKSNARNFAERDRVDLATLKLVTLFTSQQGALFFDNVRLDASGLPEVPGLRAFDFGPVMSAVYPGFTGCTDKTAYSPEAGFGWIGAMRADNAYMPDSLTGDYVSGQEFRVNVPNGTYEVNFCMDAFGLWGWYPNWQWRKVALNDREVLNEKMTGDEFMARLYFAHEDNEDLPGQDLWRKYIEPRQVMRRHAAEVTDGVLRVRLSSDNFAGQSLLFLVVYPDAAKDKGREWMAALDRQRSEKFRSEMVVRVPEADGDAVSPSAADTARGFIAFARHPEVDVAVNARPAKGELDQPIALAAARGEREHAVVGLYPLTDVKGVVVTVSDLTGPAGAKIPASAVRARRIRNFLKRMTGRYGELRPYILTDFKALDLAPGVTRGIWLTIAVPENAAAGEYAGTVTVGTGDRSSTLPLKLTVWPFALDRVTDITMSVTGSTAGSWRGWYPGLDERWWKMAESVMQDQADHGMNAITGGPGARIRSIKDGKVDADYGDMDRWLAMAVKHGLTMTGDSYQGLDFSNLPNNAHKDCIEKNEAQARASFGVGYEELLRIAYGDMLKHGRESGWPSRVFSFLDEPRPEYGNIEPCAKLIQIRTRACPNVLFSGFYSTGDGRDIYFETMPVSVAHVDDKSVELVRKGGKQLWDYSGARVRHDIGRWAFVAARSGMSGFLRNGYMYVCSDPYFDYSDDEGSWSVVYPSKSGLNDAVGWERTAAGVNDYRYLLTCERLVKKARAAQKAGAQADAAAAYMAETLKPVKIADKESALLPPEGYQAFRRALAGHIQALSAALGQ